MVILNPAGSAIRVRREALTDSEESGLFETTDRRLEGRQGRRTEIFNARQNLRKEREMPSPPDVILVLSPRMARMVKFAVRVLSNEAEFLDFDDNGQFASVDEAEDAAVALMREIDDQLSHNATTVTVLEEELPTSVPPGTDVARVAAKMAKAARDAVEDDPRGPGDGLGA